MGTTSLVPSGATGGGGKWWWCGRAWAKLREGGREDDM
jgi:hypothetical protein